MNQDILSEKLRPRHSGDRPRPSGDRPRYSGDRLRHF